MMEKLECVIINAPRTMTGGTQKIVEKKGEERKSNSTITEEEQDEDDDEYYLYDEDPPPYDISEKLKEINSALSKEIIPQGYEERQRKVIFRENPVEIEIPPTPNYSSDDEDDGYGDSTETSDDLTDQNATDANKNGQTQSKICHEFANKQKFNVDLSQLLGSAGGPPKSSPNSVAEEINFLFQCFTKLSLQNNTSQPIQAQIPEIRNSPSSPEVNDNEPFLLDSKDLDKALPEEPQSAISTNSLDVPDNTLEESSNDTAQSQHDRENVNEIHQDSNLENIQTEPGLPNDDQSKEEEKLTEHSKAEKELEETGEICQRATISSNTCTSKLSENLSSSHTSTDYPNEITMVVPSTEPSRIHPRNDKPKEKCSTTQALLKWKRAMRQLYNVRQVQHRPSSQSSSTDPNANSEIQIEIEEICTNTTCSKLDAVQPVTNKPPMEARSGGKTKKKLLLTRSSASSTALFTEKKSTNFEETMVMASQGKFRMMKTEDFRSCTSKLRDNEPRHVKMAAGRPMTSVPRRPENKAKITPNNTHQACQRNMVNSSVKSKTLTLSQYPSPYRPLSVNWHKDERLDDVPRQRHLRGFSGTTFRLTPEQKAEKERKLRAIAQERQQKLERARQEKLKRKQEVEIAFKDWLRCKKMQEPNSKKPSTDEEETELNIKPHHAEKSGSPAFQDWLKRKKIQKLEELRIAEIKRKVEEKMLYIRKHEDNEKAFKKWLQTKSRESNLSSLRRKSSAAHHFGSMSKWRTDNYFANHGEF